MNIKHAKLLRKSRLHYIAAMVNNTPAGMVPQLGDIERAADTLQGIVVRIWPSLTHKLRRQCSLLLERACTGGYNLSDATAAIIRTAT